MKLRFAIACVGVALFCATPARAALVYVSGHGDIGVAFEDGGLHLHFHAEDPINLFGGGTLAAGEYDADALVIGVPGPATTRPAGSQWSFLSPNAGDQLWFLPLEEDTSKPFLGVATEELDSADGWTTPLTWSLDSITPVFGDASELAIYGFDQFGALDVKASTLEPTASGNDWQQTAGGHAHFNYFFTGEGLYEVTLSVTGTNAGGGASGIALGDYTDTATFRFATGSAIAAVPEPGSALLLGLASALCCLRRRRIDC